MKRHGPAWSATGLVAATAIVTAIATVAFANHAPWHKVFKGRAPNKTVVVTGEQETEVIDDEWHGINGARTEIRIPNGERALILVRFTAETVCYFAGPDFCSVRVMVDGKQAKPASGRDFHIDSNYGGETEESEKAHALDRSLEVGPGRYTIKVQGTAMDSTILKVDDWSLTVERVST
jgi:hypothetical protein